MAFLKELKKEDSIKLYKYSGKDLGPTKDQVLMNEQNYIKVCFVDLETTGLDFAGDEIIEIGIKTIAVNKSDYRDFKAIKAYESYQDTEIEISPEITQLTGISKDMIEGHSIEWGKVEDILGISDIVVAHNASFDRAFLEKNIDFKNVWACSKNDVNWKERGFFNTKLELLSIWHGFYYDSHRAMNDVNATIHLLLHPSYKDFSPLEELVENSQKTHKLIINKFPYNESFIKMLKKRGGYRYNSSDRSWRILIKDSDVLDQEVDWLKKNIYNGYFQGEIKEISLYNKYKV
tara:strand:- start:608 stop:1477 length:870 start_codon:yes stop_codon:yes gene_type:complete